MVILTAILVNLAANRLVNFPDHATSSLSHNEL
jgi:hypothetical protein